ncbi:MAG TPA: DegV family protein [Ruminococcus sp.]
MKTSFREKYFGENVHLRLKLCRIALLLGAVGLFLNALSSIIIMKQGFMVYILPFTGSIAFLVTFGLSYKFRFGKNILFLSLLMMNLVLMPISFMTSGGAESGNPMWMMLGLVFIFMFLDGWRFYFLLIVSILIDITMFILGVYRPELVTKLDSGELVRQDVAVSLIISAFIIGAAFRFQNTLYNKERKLAKERAEEIEELSNSRSLFFANMSHEIRTPINTILGLNEMILRDAISDEVAENAMNVQSAGKLLLSLINDILDISKIESGKMEIVPAQYETAAMFSDIVNIIWIRASRKKLDFKVDIDEELPSMLYGDEGRLKQVIINILTNAVKYTEKGSVVLTVKSERTEGNKVRLKIAVSDTGIGIRREDFESIFTVFKRADSGKTKKIEGTGLGLAISKQLIDMMNGTISVDSIYQKGSCFTVTVDQQIVNEAPVGSVRYMIKRDITDKKIYKQSFEAPNAEVLIVDDNEMNLIVARKLLRDTKISVDTALSGRECLEKTRRKFYHVILMDHMMPEMDGEETLKLLRSRVDGFCQKTPVIAVTAHVMSNASEFYESKGFEGYLAKPISGALLEAAMQKFLPAELIEYAVMQTGSNIGDTTAPLLFHSRKKKVCISADCICDLPVEWIEKLDIKLMYCYITTEKGRFMDTKEICSDELLGHISDGRKALSSCASTDEYEAFFSDRLMEAESVIHISVSSGVGGEYFAASKAAEGFDNVTVIDSGHISSGMGIIVLNAAKMAQDGASPELIRRSAESLREKISASFIMGSTEYMYRNGKVSKMARDICNALNIHPVMHMHKDRIAFRGFMTGKIEKAGLRYVRSVLMRSRKIDDSILLITYAGCGVSQLERIRQEALKYKKFDNIKLMKASSAISCNCGTNCFGLFYIKK